VGLYNAGVSISGARTWNSPASISGDTQTQPLRQWSLDNFGEDLLALPREGRLYVWDESNGTANRAVVVSTAPSASNFMFVSQQDRHVICLGTHGVASGFDPMLVRWSDQNDYTNWNVNVSSTSGENQLGDGSELITGLNTRNQSLIWTDNAVHAMEFVGPPFIFNFRQLGSNCGIAGQHAASNLMVVYSGWVPKISLCMMVLLKIYHVLFVVMYLMILTMTRKTKCMRVRTKSLEK